MRMRHMLAGALPLAVLVAGMTVTDKLPFLQGGFSIARAMTAAFSYVGKTPVVNVPGVALGAYDPHADFKNLDGVKIEHIFLPWQDVDLSSLGEADSYAQARGRSLLITVEPWSWSKEWRLTRGELRAAIASGQYDPNIVQICQAIGNLKSAVTIRWGHEMDDRSGQFTWSGWTPADYIAAYRRFVDRCRPLAPAAKFMWSPKGDSDMNDYYPGDAYVDSVGLSVFGLQQYDRDKFGHDRTFSEILAPPYKLASVHDKPVVVAELGYAGDETYVKQWASSVTKMEPEFPKLTAVVYFDDREIYPWPKPYGLPDWRVVSDQITN